ncbi:biofilm-associated protein [Candidatus Nitrosotenuis uzonensis]|uniref:Biofilm-associated protein n=1 Tax=Candidatus Nitrosotenuis uzonensis TaxID=1407055 RepID=V6AU37_9ARCH|nr:biofilm-associated protein [Candidatus Nitrosotenuis uzonensis]CDI06099.1 conserved exported hypothetical protein [Candidatus Nitrosotenuis uzonensis]
MFIDSKMSMRMLFVALMLFAAVAIGVPAAFAETAAKGTGFEKTSIIEFTNNDTVEINTVRIWLGKDIGDFKSFKTEKGWTGTKSAEGLLIFTSSKPLKPGESVKFGIKTEVGNPAINWRTLDTRGNELTTGRTEIGKPVQDTSIQTPKDTPQTPVAPAAPTNLDSAKFRIIPESPKNGDEIRVIGEGFPPNSHFNFLIDNEKLDDFSSDGSGNVLGRAKIPLNKQEGRVEFALSDDQGQKKTLSIRIVGGENIATVPSTQKLVVNPGSNIFGPGDTATVSGMAKPGSAVAITAKDASGKKIYEAVAQVDSQGKWSHETVIPPDAELGTRTIEFTNGQETITKTISISVTKTIRITPSSIRYEPGDRMLFNGTASTTQPVEIFIKDPIGKEIYSDILTVNETGTINFGFQTTQTSTKGTYVVIATQGQDSEILRIGLGEAPSEQLVAKFDKLNYASTETARLTIQGPAKAAVSLLIIDPSDRAKLTDSVTLGLDGRKDYEINLSGYKSGVYSVVLKYLKSQVSEVFAVGLSTGSGEIKLQATKQTYLLGEGMLLLGSSKPNVLIKLEMYDPSGELIKRKEVFTDKEGKFSEGTFRIPADAKQGMWVVRGTSGPNYAETKVEVVGTVEQAFVVNVDKSTPYRSGDLVKIVGAGGGKTQTVIVTMFDPKGAKYAELNTFSTSTGSFQITWKVPGSIDPGEYKIVAKLGNDNAETKLTIQ